MLVLTRRPGQSIQIGDAIEIQIVRVDGDRVAIGIAAPRDVPIVRSELLAAVSEEVRSAGQARSAVLGLLPKER